MQKLARPLVFIAILVLCCCQKADEPSQSISLFIMDSFTEIKAVGPKSVTEPAMQAAVAAVKHVDQLLGYKSDSSENVLNREHRIANREIYNLIALGLGIEKATGGAFAWNLRPILDAYGFTGKHPYRLPTPAEFAAWKRLPGDSGIRLEADGQTVVTDPALQLELGSLGDGYAADLAAAALKAHGVKAGLINSGGEVVAFGDRTWKVAIRHPRQDGYLTVLPVKNRTVSTSGDYERFFMQGGRRYCHILDPRTGYSPSHYISVTTVAANCAEADAWSTALFICDIASVKDELKRRNIDWLIVTSDGRILKSAGIKVDLPARIDLTKKP